MPTGVRVRRAVDGIRGVGRAAAPGALRAQAGPVSIENTTPSAIGGAVWSALAGPWEIDFSYASMRAVERHPFNDSTGPRSFWWVLRRDGEPIGMYAGYITETYNFSTLFTVGPLHVLATVVDVGYRWLNRHGLYRHLNRYGMARLLRISAGRSRVMFLGGHTADVGGHVIGEATRDEPAATYLPAIVRMIEAHARWQGVEQITFREAAERDAGPFRYPSLWEARDAGGKQILPAAGYRRNPGFPPGYLDLREVQARFPNDGDGVYAYYRHESPAAFAAYDSARRSWLTEMAAQPDGAAADASSAAVVLRHPHLAMRTEETRLHRFRGQLFRSGILPDALVGLAQLDHAERALKTAPQTMRRLERLRGVRAELQRRAAVIAAELPAGADAEAHLSARALAAGDAERDWAAIRRLAAAHAEERNGTARADPRFASLSSGLRSKYTELVAGRIRHEDLEQRRLLTQLGWRADAPAEERARIEAIHEERLALARTEGPRDRVLRRLRTEIAQLVKATGVKAEEAQRWADAQELLDRHGGHLPAEIEAILDRLATIRAREAETSQAITDGEEHLQHEATAIQAMLLGRAGDAMREDLEHGRRAGFRKEQDRIATQRAGGRAPASARERRALLEAALRYRPLDYRRMLIDIEGLRDSDRDRLVREHEAYQATIRRAAPDQPEPEMPAFDDEGYLAEGLQFVGRDERVWTNLPDQDQVTRLYHRTMAASMIRHDVEDWPYRAAYREAGRETGDEIHVSTLRAGGPTGPIVAAVSLKRSPAGHFRPERIAKPGGDFGAYYALVLLVMAHEVERGGTWCSLGQTSQGTKMRDFGASFIDVREYTRFRGLVPLLFGFDLIRRQAFRKIHVDRILEIAALPPDEREAATKRHGIRWHI